MGRLVNELSWSRTRIATLENCERAYYFQYYQKWEGWAWDAPDDKRRAYQLSKMTNLPMLVGHAVHETIRLLLASRRDPFIQAPADPVDHMRRNILTKIWRDAEAGLWKRDLKSHPPVFEIYYDVDRSSIDLKAIGAHAASCLETFLASDLYRELAADDTDRWLAVDDPPSFDDREKHKLDGRTIWALPDFARRTESGDCEIWDWKTGRPSPHDRHQLQSYALHARDRWGFAPDRIKLRAFYLANGEIGDYPCDAASLAEMENRIRDDFRRMETFLIDATSNTPLPRDQAFRQLPDGPTCRACFFRELCDR